MWFILEVEGERRGVYRDVVLARKVLLSGGEEALGEEKPADPKNLACGVVSVYQYKGMMASATARPPMHVYKRTVHFSYFDSIPSGTGRREMSGDGD